MTQWEKMNKKLLDNGIETYSPSTKVGECDSPYVVIKEDGSSKYQQLSTAIDYYSVMCYVPQDSYSQLAPYVMKVQEILHELQPEIVCTNDKTPSFYDDTNKSHMISVMYRNFKKLSGIIA